MAPEKQAVPQPVVLRPPLGLQISRWFAFTATVAIAVGILAMLDQHLTDIPWVYDGPRPEFKGRTVSIDYCMLSASVLVPSEIRCRLAFSAAAVSLALSLIWTYIQSLRRNPYKHRNARIADFVLCLLATAWWVACGIILSLWAHQANVAGLRNKDWRNGLCVLAWAEFIFFAYLTITSALLLSSRSQKLFDKWEAKKQLKKQQRHAAKNEKMQRDAEEAEAAAAAAKHKPAQHHHAVGDNAPAGAAPAAAATQQQPHSAAAAPPGQQSAWPSSSAAGPSVLPVSNAGADNPFLAGEQTAGRQPVGEHAV